MRTIDSTEELLACSEAIREVSHLLIDADEQTEFALRQLWAAGRDWERGEGYARRLREHEREMST